MTVDYVREGEGDVIILVHGALADKRMWLPHIVLLKSGYDVAAPTLRHFGKPSDGGFGLNTHADDLASFLGELGSPKPLHLVAWSYGADVVLNMLTRHELPVTSAFLYEPGYPGCVAEEAMQEWSADANEMFGPVFALAEQQRLPEAVGALIDGSGRREGYFDSQPAEYQRQQLENMHTIPLQLNKKEQPQLDASALGSLELPVTVAWGRSTRPLFSLVSTSVYRALPNAWAMPVEAANHMLPLETPERFVGLVRTHLQRSSAAQESPIA